MGQERRHHGTEMPLQRSDKMGYMKGFYGRQHRTVAADFATELRNLNDCLQEHELHPRMIYSMTPIQFLHSIPTDNKHIVMHILRPES